MCGFFGVYHKKENSLLDISPILNIIRHRGPDDTGFYNDPYRRCQFGFVRLSIIDIASGKQPVKNETGKIIAVLNGEIYNYVELRESLIAKGHVFTSKGDAETLVHLYEEYGLDFVKYLEGMFAIVLWDENAGRLVLARDHLGIKPLYYSTSDDMIGFSSEIKPLLRLPQTGREVDEQGVVQYLSYGYTLTPHTIFRNIKKLNPGTFLVVDGGMIAENNYWDIDAPQSQIIPEKELKSAVLDAFDRSVRLHLRSDVPVGAFLSGGIDSGFLVARAAHLHPRLKTYTLRFAGSPFDETPLAALVAEKYDTDHTTFTVNPDLLLSYLPHMVWVCDEPLADSGLLPNFVINKLAAEDGIKVVLNGAGGDELFAGYSYYFSSPIEQKLLKYHQLLPLAVNVSGLFNKELERKLRRTLSYKTDISNHYLGHVTVWPHDEIQKLIQTKCSQEFIRGHYFEKFHGDDLNARLYSDLKTYLTDDLMLLLDRTTMAHSIEGRVPYLDHLFVELVMGIPAEIKAPSAERKSLLKEIARPFLPERLFSQSKMGFNSPISAWMQGELGSIADRILRASVNMNRPWRNSKAMLNFLNNPESRSKYFHRYYTLFMLELFFIMHVDNSYDTPPVLSIKEL